MQDFGTRLKALRRQADITQSELADVLGVVASAVGKYERQPNAYPSVEVLIKIADFFHTSTDYLLRGTGVGPAISNHIGGDMTNSTVAQAHHGGVYLNNAPVTPEGAELLRVYNSLSGRDRLKLLNFALTLEDDSK